MKIGLCHPYLFPNKGGAETYILDFARELLRHGHEVHLYAWKWQESALPKGLHAIRVPGPERCWRPRRPWLFNRGLAKVLPQAQPMISIGFDKTLGTDIWYPQGGLYRATLEGNIRIGQTTYQKMWMRLRQIFDLGAWSFLHLEHQQVRCSQTTVVVNSEMVGEHLQQLYGIKSDSIRVIRSAIDPNRFATSLRWKHRETLRQTWGLTNKIIGLFAATNYALKGLEPLLYAVAELPSNIPFHLFVVGSSRQGRYQRLAQRLGIFKQVTFAGHWADMKQAYLAADFLIHPTWYDPCSLVVLEALGCGLPVITSVYNGAKELLQPLQAGIVVQPESVDSIRQAIEMLLDTSQRTMAQQAAKQAAHNWTFADHYLQWEQLLHQLWKHKPMNRQAA